MPPGLDTDRRPLVLIWEVTQACDLACEHCRADANPDPHPQELSTAEGKRLLDQTREFGAGQLVVLSGGDPCKRSDLVELVSYGTDIGLTMTLTPSGTAQLTRETIEDLADAGLRRIALSIDGASPRTHDEFRGEDGIFEETVRAARAVRDVGLPLQVNTTVCARTVEELPGIRDLVSDHDAVLWSVFFLVPVGRGAMLEPISPARSEEIMDWLGQLRPTVDFSIKTTEAPQYRRVMHERDGDAHSGADGAGLRRRSGIIAGDGFAFVSHTGDVFPSGFLPLSAGSVREQSVVDIYRDSPLFQQLRNRDQLTGKCGACPYRYLCGGSRSRAFAYTGDPLESDPLCPYVPPDYDGPLPEQSVP